MQPLTWTRKPETATMIGAHQVYEAKSAGPNPIREGTRIRIVKFGDGTQCEETYPYTITVASAKTNSVFVNVASPASYGAHMLLDNTLVSAPCFVQLFNAEMREVDYNFATLKEAKAAVESMAFMFVNWMDERPEGWPYTAGSFIPEPRRY